MSDSVLDTSALTALLNRETGHQQVARAVRSGAAISTVNLAEVVAKLTERGAVGTGIRAQLTPLDVEVRDFGQELAYQTGLLRPLTRQTGLSLGDRACLALARELDLSVLTADRAWGGLHLGVVINVIR